MALSKDQMDRIVEAQQALVTVRIIAERCRDEAMQKPGDTLRNENLRAACASIINTLTVLDWLRNRAYLD